MKNIPVYFPEKKLVQNIFSNPIFKDKQVQFPFLYVLFSLSFPMLCNNKTLFTADILYKTGFISKVQLDFVLQILLEVGMYIFNIAENDSVMKSFLPKLLLFLTKMH